MTSSSERKDSLINKSFHCIFFFPYVHVHGFYLLAYLYMYFLWGGVEKKQRIKSWNCDTHNVLNGAIFVICAQKNQH